MCHFSDGSGKTDSTTKVAGNDTIAGQIASFMENLHLSYEEVYEKIPYPLLLIMQKDKLHIIYGDTVKEVSARNNPKFLNRIE